MACHLQPHGAPPLQSHGAPFLQPHPEVRSPQGEASKDGAGHRSHPPSSFEAPAGHLRMRADRCACRRPTSLPSAVAAPRHGAPSLQPHGMPSLQPHSEVRSPQGEASKDGAGHRSHPPSSFEAPAGHLRMRADRLWVPPWMRADQCACRPSWVDRCACRPLSSLMARPLSSLILRCVAQRAKPRRAGLATAATRPHPSRPLRGTSG
ncbi:UNVERIFIED_ORG: hypothetical protein GGD58_005679 [Rhizobium pisi]